MDLRSINKHSIVHKFHLQSASSHLANLKPGLIYNSFDYSNFYSSIKLSDEGKRLFALCTERFGSWYYCKLPQGYCVSPGLASQLSSALTAQLPPGYIQCYCDDNIQAGMGSTMEEAIDNLLHKMDKFLEQVVIFNLRLGIRKCKLFTPTCTHLGFIISSTSISLKPDTLQGILQYPIPSSPADVKKYCGILVIENLRSKISDFLNIVTIEIKQKTIKLLENIWLYKVKT